MLDDIKKTLWATADKLRANMDAAEYKHLVLGLIFVKYISDTFAARRAELTRRFADPADDYFLRDADARAAGRRAGRPRLLQGSQRLLGAGSGPLGSAARRRQAARHRQAHRRRAVADRGRKPQAQGHPRQALCPRPVARRQARRAGRSGLHHRLWRRRARRRARRAGPGVRILPRACSPAPKASAAGSSTRRASIVKTLVAVLAPHHGKVYDPCCGSGGMFVQSEEFIEAHGGKLGDVSIYGQEANPTTWRLAAMNLAIRGIDFNLGREPADTFTRNQHPDLRADFILANPPFNISDWWHGSLMGDRAGSMATRRRATPTTPGCSTCCTTSSPPAAPASCWPTAHESSQNSEGEIRARDGRGRRGGSDGRAARPAVLQHPDSGLPVVSGQEKSARARAKCCSSTPASWRTMISRVQSELTDEVIERIAATVAAWRGEAGCGRVRQDIAGLLPQREAGRNRRARPCADAGPLRRRRSGGG